MESCNRSPDLNNCDNHFKQVSGSRSLGKTSILLENRLREKGILKKEEHQGKWDNVLQMNTKEMMLVMTTNEAMPSKSPTEIEEKSKLYDFLTLGHTVWLKSWKKTESTRRKLDAIPQSEKGEPSQSIHAACGSRTRIRLYWQRQGEEEGGSES
jgi:hypothetical protein